MTPKGHLRDEFASAGSLAGVFKPYQILYIAILIKSIAFNHALTADLPFHAISESPVRLLYIDKILTKLKQFCIMRGKISLHLPII